MSAYVRVWLVDKITVYQYSFLALSSISHLRSCEWHMNYSGFNQCPLVLNWGLWRSISFISLDLCIWDICVISMQSIRITFISIGKHHIMCRTENQLYRLSSIQHACYSTYQSLVDDWSFLDQLDLVGVIQ